MSNINGFADNLNKLTDQLSNYLDNTRDSIDVLNNYKNIVSYLLELIDGKDDDFILNNINRICDILMTIKTSIIRTVYKNFDMSKFEVITSFKNNKTESSFIQLKNFINSFIPSLNQCVTTLETFINQKTYLVINIEQVLDLLTLDENNLFVKPIDSLDKFYLIRNVMNGCKMGGYTIVVPQMMAINEINQATYAYREKLLRQQLANKKKIQVRRELLNKGKKKAAEEIEKVETVSEADKALINKIGVILNSNQDIINAGFSEDIESGYSLIDYSEEDPFDIDILEANYQIIIYTLIKLNNMCKEGINDELRNKINITLSSYEKYKTLLNQEDNKQKEIEKFELDNQDMIHVIKDLINKYNLLNNRLTELDHNYIADITRYEASERQNVDDEEQVEEKTKNYIEQLTKHVSILNYNLFREYQYLERVYVAYSIYEEETNLEFKKLCFNDVVQEVNQYFIFKKNIESLYKSEDNVNVNNILFLPYNEEETTFGRYLSGKKLNSDDSYSLGKCIDRLLTNDNEMIFATSEKVKGGRYSEKIRRLRLKNIRLVYADLSKLCSFDFKLDKTCYIVLAGGVKHDSGLIYDYVTGMATSQAIDRFVDLVEDKARELKENYSFEEGNRLFNEFINSLITSYNEQVVNNMPNFADNIKGRIRGEE